MLEGSVVADIADAERRISDLDHRAVALGDTEALARLLLRAESVASSRIEGLVVGPRRLLRADAARESGEQAYDVTAADVLANIDAMAYAAGAIHEGDQIAPDHLLEVHRRLLTGTSLSEHAGRVREVQNWIGGSTYNPCTAAFVPPPPGLVNDLIGDLCAFCNNDALPAVAQAAIAHAQFETIHPFVDGNGRVGRALIHMVLRRRGLARRVLPPVSLVLATRASDYVHALTATRYRGEPNAAAATRSINDWIALFSGACVRAVQDAEDFEMRIAGIQASWRAHLGSVRAHSAVNALIKILPGAPVLTVKSAVVLTKRSLPAIHQAITRLIDANVLEPTRGRARNRTFEAPEIIDAFVELERQLASPAGDTRVESPARPVPTSRFDEQGFLVSTASNPERMADRRSFLGAVSGVAASVLLASKADAQAPAPQAPPKTSPLPSAQPSPKTSASPKPASALAAATALSMRRFDPSLTDKDLDTIAHAIDDNRRGAARLNPRKATGLKNADEPVTRFAVKRPRA